MDKERSMDISAAIGDYINTNSPVINYTDEDLKTMLDSIGEDSLAVMKEAGMYSGCPEELYVASSFCGTTGLLARVDDDYLAKLFSCTKKFDSKAFCNNPYVSSVKYKSVKCGNLYLTYGHYEKGEVFQYDMPDFGERLVVPKLGFFDGKVDFPTIYEGNMPWMSVCPSETATIDPFVKLAHGSVLVLGLGLGYYPFMIASLEAVEKIVIVEINEGIIELFKKYVFPFFPCREKFTFVCADAVKYLEGLNGGEFDFCFADIWEGVRDGLPLYKKIKAQESRLLGVDFCYWIEPQLKAFERYREENDD